MKDKDEKTEISINKLSELKQAKSYLETILNSSLDVIVITDSTGNIIRVNKYFLVLLDYKQNEVIGKHIAEFGPTLNKTYKCTTGESIHISEKFFEDTKKMYERFVEEKKQINWRSYFVGKKDILIPVEQNMSFFCDEKENVIGALAIIRDITERKKSEEMLLESEEKYRGVVSNVGIGIALISPNMEILSLNHQMQQWFPEADVSKKPTCYETFNNPPRKSVCSYCPTFKTLKDGRVHESVTDTPQGDKILNYRIVSSPLRDKEGKITSAIEMVEDITEQKAAQEKLQESEEKYHNLIEHANDAIVSVNSAGMIIGFNRKAEEMFGFSREEVMGKSSYEFISHQDQEFYKEALKHFAETGIEWDRDDNISEGKALKKGGAEIEIEYSYFTINLRGEFIATAIIRDISERKEVERKLIHYQNQLKSLASQITLSEEKERRRLADCLHDEIGQELFGIKIKLEMLKKSLSSTKDAKSLDNVLNNIQQVAEHARSLTVELSPPILQELGLEQALEWLAEQAHNNYSILVTFEDDKREKPLDDDVKIFLYQAVRELFTNVAKHAQTKTASVSVKKDNSNIRICVKDNGIGFVPPNKYSSNAKIEGFGLFSITERLEQLGGQIEIKSQPNCGTQVTLVTPLSRSV